jgi:signal transduction histidine kinase
MKNLRTSLGAKIAAFILCLFCAVLVVGSACGVFYMNQQGLYDEQKPDFYKSSLCYDSMRDFADDIYYGYFYLAMKQASSAEPLSSDEIYNLNRYEEGLSSDQCNFYYSISDQASGRVILSNSAGQTAVTSAPFVYNATDSGNSYYNARHDVWVRSSGSYDANDHLIEEYYDAESGRWLTSGRGLVLKDQYYNVTIFAKSIISDQSPIDNLYSAYTQFDFILSLRYIAIIVGAAALACFILLFIFLMRAAGRRKDEAEVRRRGLDFVPLDIYALGAVLICIAVCVLAFYGYHAGLNMSNNWLINFLWPGSLLILALLPVLGFFYSLSANIKAGKWWRNTVIYMLGRLIGKGLYTLFTNLPVLAKNVVFFIAFLVINGLLFTGGFIYGNGGLALLCILFNIVTLVLICRMTLQWKRLREGATKIAAGQLEAKIDTSKMNKELKEHGDNINHISDGLSAAVDERLKSERLKTELITNVSHDLKTPLTAIISYVDLLKKEKLGSEAAANYVMVLDRHSARLKKLTEDLVEASKAATGNISVKLAPTDIVELLQQSVGEYSERLAEKGLEAVIKAPEPPLIIQADGRHLWRVFDNLLNNICKYTLEKTRVYLDITETERKVSVTLKNISKYPLNISVEELMERFVRGDSARSTDGSGLGLAIARSLTQLQEGNFAIDVDGDLFKVTITFNK